MSKNILISWVNVKVIAYIELEDNDLLRPGDRLSIGGYPFSFDSLMVGKRKDYYFSKEGKVYRPLVIKDLITEKLEFYYGFT